MKRIGLFVGIIGAVLLLFLLTPTVGPAPVWAAGPVPTGTGNVIVVVQNTDTNVSDPPANVLGEFIGSSGNVDASLAKTIPPLASAEFSVSETTLPAGWSGGMVLSSDRQLAAVAYIYWTNRPTKPEVGAYSAFSSGATTFYLPSMAYQDDMYRTLISVQNVDTGDASVTMSYSDRNGVLTDTKTDTIPQAAAHLYDFAGSNPADPDLPQGWMGSCIITSNKNITVAVSKHWPLYAAASNGQVQSGLQLIFPSHVRTQLTSTAWHFTGLQIQNLSPTEVAHVHLLYRNRDGVTNLEFDDTIPSLAAHGYNTLWGGNAPGGPQTYYVLGNSWMGSVTVTSDQPIVGTYEIRNDQTGTAITADGVVGTGSTKVFVPAVHRVQSGSTWGPFTGMQVQNMSASNPANIHMYFYDQDGNLDLDFTDTIPANSAHGFNTRWGGNTPGGWSTYNVLGTNWTGSVYIESSDQPIAATVDTTWEYQASTYNAFNF